VSARKWLWTLLRAGVTLGAFAYLATLVDLGDLAAAFGRAPLGAFAAVLGWYSVAMFLGAWRWGLLLTAFGASRRPPAWRLLRLYWVGLFYNTFLPGGVGGDVVRGVATREAFGEGSTTAGLSVVLVERALGLSGLLLLTAGVTLARPIQGVPEPRLLGGAGLLAVGVALLGLLFARRLAPHLPRPLGRLAASFPVPVRYAPIAVVLAACVVGHVVVSLGGHTLVHALAPSVALHESLVIIPIALAAVFVPITVSGAGVREAAFVALYGTVGVEQGVALAASLGMWGCQLVLAALGGLLALATPLAPAARPRGAAGGRD